MRILNLILLSVLPVASFASATMPLQKAKIDLTDTGSLQRGARNFVGYCMGCHSLNFSSYTRLGKDLKLKKRQVKESFIRSWRETKKMSAYMRISMSPAQGKAIFSVPPPDLSTIARARGVDYLYTYMLSFYQDPKRPYGVNNLVFPNVGMPHVTVGLQGLQRAIFKKDKKNENIRHFVRFETIRAGTMTPAEYKLFVSDLVNFLAYVGEPSKLERLRMAPWIMLFLILFTIIAKLLKLEYWKDIH